MSERVAEQDLLASGLYAVNWTLAGRSVDYLSQADAPSPVQHFWSLAVEEQFYVFWPLLLLLATLLVRPRWGRASSKRVFLRGRAEHGDHSLTKPLMLAMTLIAVPSFAWSVYLTQGDPGPAYFVTTTRVWELAIGGAVAILAVQLSRMPKWVAAPLAWTGLAAVIATALLLTKNVPFPGSVAAIPVLGTAAVIAGGHAAGRCGPALLLGTAPARWIGKLSYSLYLWHWPLIVIATAKLGGLTMQQGLAVAVLSLIPAWLSFRFVEEPARRAENLTRNPKRALELGYFCTMAGVMAGLLLAVLPTPIPPASPAAAVGAPPVVATAGTEPAKYGAQVLPVNPRNDNAGAPVDRVGPIAPDPLQAVSDFDKTCTPTPTTGSSVSTCNLGAADAATEVAVAGDSHIQQWLPALRQIAQDRRWAMTVYLHDACPFVDAPLVRGPGAYEPCMKWNDSVRELLEESRPSLVITSFSTTSADVATGAMADALRQSWKHYTDP